MMFDEYEIVNNSEIIELSEQELTQTNTKEKSRNISNDRLYVPLTSKKLFVFHKKQNPNCNGRLYTLPTNEGRVIKCSKCKHTHFLYWV